MNRIVYKYTVFHGGTSEYPKETIGYSYEDLDGMRRSILISGGILLCETVGDAKDGEPSLLIPSRQIWEVILTETIYEEEEDGAAKEREGSS